MIIDNIEKHQQQKFFILNQKYFLLDWIRLLFSCWILVVIISLLFRPGTKRGKQRNSMSNISTMETVLFGQGHLSIKYGTVRTRLAIAATIYKVCKRNRL